MTVDFNTIINEALKRGMTAEDIAKGVSEALNKTKEEQKPVETCETLKIKMADTFRKNVANGKVALSDAANIISLLMLENSEVGKAIESPDEICALFNYVLNDITTIDERWKLHCVMKDVAGFFINSKDKEENCGCGEDCSCGKSEIRHHVVPVRLDADRIADFFNKMGLI